MGNCFITKLKASVNNPNLPVRETMQQFTLDAIAASGNDNMTDAQKWALNHFFYQIGAIDNTGIFSKLEFLNLAFMCGSKQGALTDFAKSNVATGTTNETTFSNGGFISDTDGRHIATYDVDAISDSYFYFIAVGNTNAQLRTDGTRNDATCNQSFSYSKNNKNITLSVYPYTTFASLVSVKNDDIQYIDAASVSIMNHRANVLAIKNNEVIGFTNVMYHGSEEGFASDILKLTGYATNSAPYAAAFGSGLTDAEQLKFMQEIKTLINAFA